MNNNLKKLPDRIAFIADAHLGMPGDEHGRSEKMVAFLRWLNGKVSHLYIVGDLFDFWFEYKSVVPNTSPQVIFELYNLIQTGTKVTIIVGNHDYWLGPYFSESVGVTIEADEVICEHQGKKLYIHHGDGLHTYEYGYRFLKKILRNRISITLFRFLHPDFASWIARTSSKFSRNFFAIPDFESKNTALFKTIADERLKDGYDAVIYGHAHVPLIEKRCDGTLVLLGDWINHNTFVFLENGEFILNSWNATEEKFHG